MTSKHKTPEHELPVLDHLAELRRRLIIISVSLLIATMGFYFFTPVVFRFLVRPIASHQLQLVYFTIAEGFTLRVKIAFFLGFIVTSPILFYQVAAFVNPGLTAEERRVIYRSFVFLGLLFILGFGCGFFIFLPVVVEFFIVYGQSYLHPLFSGSAYVSFSMMFAIVSGLVFLFPFVLITLGRLGFLSVRNLAKWRIKVWLALFTLGTLLAPATNWLIFVLLAVPLILLYEFSYCWLFFREKGKGKRKK